MTFISGYWSTEYTQIIVQVYNVTHSIIVMYWRFLRLRISQKKANSRKIIKFFLRVLFTFTAIAHVLHRSQYFTFSAVVLRDGCLPIVHICNASIWCICNKQHKLFVFTARVFLEYKISVNNACIYQNFYFCSIAQ